MKFFTKKNNQEADKTPIRVEAVTPAPPQPIEYTQARRLASRILGSTQLQRVRDAKRLAETKLQGQEESLARLAAQQQWLRRYSETRMALDREKKRLFELGKQRAILASDASMLERYDLFEGIHGIYQKLAVVSGQIGQEKRGLSQLERENEECRHTLDDQEKEEQQAVEQEKAAVTAFHATHDNICDVHRITGNSEALEAEADFLQVHLNNVREEMTAVRQLVFESEGEISRLSAELEGMNAQRQGMEMHENMVQHGEATLLRLNLLVETDRLRTALQRRQQDTLRLQNEKNEMLGKAFAEYQNLISQTDTIEAEMSMHRSYLQGQDGLMLQQRALTLKGRRQMLLAALSLWKRISTGHDAIDLRSSRVTQLRLKIRQLEDNVRQMAEEAGTAHRQCKEKEYTYLLSKGQDIIQLRADLSEGVACSVCGATHHPYHSDTMLDQSKLIGEMKTDYEMLAAESRARQQRLDEVRLELATATGQLTTEEEILNTIRIRQNEDLQEWQLYAGLDPSFATRNETPDIESRTMLLRQYIENVTRDAELAEKELEAFTFHQSSNTALSERLQQLEQRKSEISVRLNELNTACQVLSREVEQLGVQLNATNKTYTALYEHITKTVTVKDWYTGWQKAPEQMHERIQQIITGWNTLDRSLAAKRAELHAAATKQENLQAKLQRLEQAQGVIADRIEQIGTLRAKNDKACREAIPDDDAKGLYQKHVQATEAARARKETESARTARIRHDIDIMQGRHDFYLENIARLEEAQSALSQELDLWKHAFNLHHPPVRPNELDEVFADGKDWSQLRSRLRQIEDETLLCQARVEDLNSRIIALDTEEGRCAATDAAAMDGIAARQEVLVSQRGETMMQIARLSVQLEEHEKAIAAQRNSAEPSETPETGNE